jgi:rubrerythrin
MISVPRKRGEVVDLRALAEHLQALAALERTPAPVISCYLSFQPRWEEALGKDLDALRQAPNAGDSLKEATGEIWRFLRNEDSPRTTSVVCFARGGAAPFFLGLRLQVPLPALTVADSIPHLFPLAELRTSSHRFPVLLVTETAARILEVDLGIVTEHWWRTRPELRRRVGREWTPRHYENHRRERTRLFLKEAVRALADRLAAGGYGHFVLAGEPRAMAAVRKALPKHLADRLSETVPIARDETFSALAVTTKLAADAHQQQESRRLVDRLLREMHSSGTALAGTGACFDALKRGRARTLLVAREFEPPRGWSCTFCGLIWTQETTPAACPKCGGRTLALNVKEEIVRIALAGGCQVETVAGCEALIEIGGLGCLLAQPHVLRKTA